MSSREISRSCGRDLNEIELSDGNSIHINCPKVEADNRVRAGAVGSSLSQHGVAVCDPESAAVAPSHFHGTHPDSASDRPHVSVLL